MGQFLDCVLREQLEQREGGQRKECRTSARLPRARPGTDGALGDHPYVWAQ